jgi:hypothetical protein
MLGATSAASRVRCVLEKLFPRHTRPASFFISDPPQVFGLAKSAFRGDGAYNKTVKTRTSSADVIQWSGCKDAQTSADATIASKATGAMSWAFIAALKDKPEQSYKELLNSVRDLLEAKYTQKPQLCECRGEVERWFLGGFADEHFSF